MCGALRKALSPTQECDINLCAGRPGHMHVCARKNTRIKKTFAELLHFAVFVLFPYVAAAVRVKRLRRSITLFLAIKNKADVVVMLAVL